MTDPLDTTLAQVRATATITPELPVGEVLRRRSAVLFALYRLKEYVSLLDDGIIEWMQDNEATEIEIGDDVLYLTNERSVKRRTVNALPIWNAILEATGGDLDAALNCLSSNAMKQGAVKAVLGEAAWEEFFLVEYQDKLKLGERPKELPR